MVRKRNKRGSLDDLVWIIGVLLVFSLMILIFAKFTDEVNTKVQDMDIIPTSGKTAVSQMNDLYGGVIDNSFLLLTVGLAIVALIFAFLVVIHPIFFVFYFIFLTIIIFVSGAVSNIYQSAAAEPALASIAAKLTMTSHIMTYLPFIIGVFGFLIAIVMYKTWQER